LKWKGIEMMKKLLLNSMLLIVSALSFTINSKYDMEINTVAGKDADTGIEENANNDIQAIDLEYNEHADRFEYKGRKYFYSKILFIKNQDYTYFILDEENKEIAITGISNAKGEVSIPGELDGYRVRCLGVPLASFSAYEENLYDPMSQYSIFHKEDRNKITGLIIPEGVKHIGIAAFMDMTRLKKVSLPDSLVSIGIEAFARDGIEELMLPKNLEHIDIRGFSECKSLTKVTVNSSSIGGGGGGEYPPFTGCDKLELVTWGNVEYADVDLFALSKIKKVIIPSSVKAIDMTACNIETLIIKGKSTKFITNKDLARFYWNDKFSVIVPKDSAAINTIKELNINYTVVTLPEMPAITKSIIGSESKRKIKLTWKKQKDNITYQIYYSEERDGKYTLLDEVKGQAYTTGKKKGYIKIRAYKSDQGVKWYGKFKLVKL
jgi:hypothetical protein